MLYVGVYYMQVCVLYAVQFIIWCYNLYRPTSIARVDLWIDYFVSYPKTKGYLFDLMLVFLGTVLGTLSNMRSNNDNHGGHFYSALSVQDKHTALY